MEALHIHYSVQETECCKVSRDLWVIAQRELTLDYGGSDRSPLHFLLLCPHPFMSPLPPSVHLDEQTATTQRTRDCITAVLWSDGRWRVYCVAADRMTDGLWALLCHCSAWPQTAMTGGERLSPPRLTALLGLPCDLWGKQREECGRRRGRLSDLQITHGKKQIGLIWEHAHTCARGKANHEPHCCRQSQ